MTTDAVARIASISATFTDPTVAAGQEWLTATATAENGSTSEFSKAVLIKAATGRRS